nr:MAG TPA: hypothetical protein [Caudoviricetes sp.]
MTLDNKGRGIASGPYSLPACLLRYEAINSFEAPKIKNSPKPHGQGSLNRLTIINMNVSR